MKILILAGLLFVAGSVYAQAFENLKDVNGRRMVRGFVTDSILRNDTAAFRWYREAHNEYKPGKDVVKAFAAQKDFVHFIVFMGSWCPDSHYIIPRFYKILEAAGFDKNRVSLIALDRTKRDSLHLAAAFDIDNVPTIIVYKRGREQGRVVEYGPVGKFDETLAQILMKE